MVQSLLLVPRSAAERIRTGGSWGRVSCRISYTEQVATVVAISDRNDNLLPVDGRSTHFLAVADARIVGRWYRVPAELHAIWVEVARRTGIGLPVDVLAERLPSGLASGDHIALTYAPDVHEEYLGVGVPVLVAWHVADGLAIPMSVDVEPEILGALQLAPGWPVADLASTTVLAVGAGSIGGAAALATAAYGVGRVLLLDPDRLLWHNLVRHVGSPRDVGRLKVTALKEQIRALRPDIIVEAYDLNVVTDADRVRGLLGETNLVLCTADGVAPRRVVSHLTRRAGLDAVLACVLEDGAFGEIMRLRPWPTHGCLTCHRDRLKATGGIDPEPALDASYGSGTRHRPMTAVGGDLHLVGQFAAKTAVATLLERRGHSDQQLPGEHALIALRPGPGRTPPFDLKGAGEVRWAPAWAPLGDCPTCEAP